MEKAEFQMDLCVLVVATYAKKIGLHFGKELPTKREFGSFAVDRYIVAVKKDSSDMFPEIENLYRSDPVHFIVKYIH